MRTTLDIDDDVLTAAKELAAKERKTAGKVLSEAFRLALHQPSRTSDGSKGKGASTLKNGVPVVASRGEIVTSAHVEWLKEEEGV